MKNFKMLSLLFLPAFVGLIAQDLDNERETKKMQLAELLHKSSVMCKEVSSVEELEFYVNSLNGLRNLAIQLPIKDIVLVLDNKLDDDCLDPIERALSHNCEVCTCVAQKLAGYLVEAQFAVSKGWGEMTGSELNDDSSKVEQLVKFREKIREAARRS